MLKRTVLYIFLGIIIIGTILFFQVRQITSEPENLWTSSNIDADCGVVLTGGSGRLREGFELLAQKKIKKLIVSGVNKDSRLIEIFPYMPYYPEVSESDLILEKRSETTFGNARFSLNLAEGLRCRDVTLITSQVHMSRAYSIFRVIFPESIPIKKLSTPNSKSEVGVWGLGVEVFKSLFYHILNLVERLESK